MKTTKRIISALLAIMLAVGCMGTGWISVAVTAVPTGYSAHTAGNYRTVPGGAYMLGSTVAITDSQNFGARSATTVDVKATIFDAAASKDGNGKWTGGTQFTKGLGVHPVSSTVAAYTIVDISKYTVSNFYAAVGITHNGIKGDGNPTDCGLNFKVYGSADGTGYSLLAESGTVKRGASGEFDVSIAGYKMLKLETSYVSGTGAYASLNAMWANACVYCEHDLEHVSAKAATKTEAGTKEHWHCKICDRYFTDANAVNETTLAAVTLLPTAYKAVPGGALMLGTDIAIASSANGGSKIATAVDTCYNSKDPIVIRDDEAKKNATTGRWTGGTKFENGLGVHPVSSTVAGETVFDITGKKVSKFYAVVGITHDGVKGDGNPTDCGVNFKVSGTKDGEIYTLLTESGTVKRGGAIQLEADIAGYTGLKLETFYVSGTGTYASLASAWGNACVYCEHSTTFVAAKDATKEEAGCIAHYECTICGKYFSDEKATAELSEEEVIIPKLAFSLNTTGEYAAVPENAQPVTAAMVTDSKNFSNSRNSIVVDPTTTTRLIDAKASKGTTWTGGTQFTKGLSGGHPINATTPGYILLNISGCKGNRFYSAVGLTDGSKTTNAGLIFKVYGTKDGTNYTLLSQSEAIQRGVSGEFDVDITGCIGLKLTYEHDGAGTYASMSNMWANACIYCAHDLEHLPAKSATVSTMGNLEYWKCTVCGKCFSDADGKTEIDEQTVLLPKIAYSANTTGTYMTVPANRLWLSTDLTAEESKFGGSGVAAKTDKTYDNTAIKILDCTAAKSGADWSSSTGGTSFDKGLGVHPKNASTEGYAIYDLTGLKVNRFYSAVGLTKNAATDHGVCFKVYGMKSGESAFTLLQSSGEIKRGASGEFNVDITGCTKLKISIECTGANASLSSVFANACVYCDHDLTHFPAKAATKTENGNVEYWYCNVCGKYYLDEDCTKETTATDVIVSVQPYNANTNGIYTTVPAGSLYLGTDVAIASSANGGSNAATTVNACYGTTATKIQLRDVTASKNGSGRWTGGTTFEKGLGVHPCGKAKEGYTVFDITDLKVDHFYAAVGITHDGIKGDGNPTDCGVNFQLMGSTDNTTYVLLAQSGTIKRGASGEFNVDITGYKSLKLLIACTDNYESLAAAWANACLYCSHPETEHVSGKPATATETGILEHWICKTCGLYFADEDCKVLLDPADIILPVLPYKANTSGVYKAIPEGAVMIGSELPVASSINGGSKIASAVDACYNSKDPIVLRDTAAVKDGKGEWKGGTTFAKGLGVHPCGAATPGDTFVDLSDISVDRFYAAVGITHNGIKGTGDPTDCGVNFKVYGTKDGNTYKLLGESGTVKRGASGEFVVDITGYTGLKLSVACTDNYESLSSAWANACVYRQDGTHDHILHKVNEKSPTTTEDGHIAYWTCYGCDKLYSDEDGLHEISAESVVIPRITGAYGDYTPNTDGIYLYVPSGVTYISDMNYASYVIPKGGSSTPRTATKDTAFSGGVITLGESRRSFSKGLGVLPSEKNSTKNCYVRVDVSTLDVDHFYAVTGITGSASNPSSAYYGVNGITYYVYGSKSVTKSELAQDYTLLASSGDLMRRQSGEFNVDITGYKTLLLVTTISGAHNYGCDAAWAKACVYNSSEITLEKRYNDGGYTATNGNNKGINPVSGSVIWLSDLTYVDSKNVGSAKKVTAKDHPYGEKDSVVIALGEDTKFMKGLGVHPSGYTLYNISNLDRDTFYASVGITNTKGKNGKSEGVIFLVMGDYGNGEYEILAQSGVITGRMMGEFRVNVKGVKNLRLVVEANGKVDSSGSAWAAACLYNADPNASFSTRLTQWPKKVPVKPSGAYTPFTEEQTAFMHIPTGAAYLSDMPETTRKSYVVPKGNDNVSREAKMNRGWGSKAMILGEQRLAFTKGMSAVASPTGKQDTYIVCDISSLPGTRFYSAVGITGSAATVTSTNYGKYGVVFYVYGSPEVTTSTNTASYTLLGCSGDIYKHATGEFDIDITGYKTLLLLVDTTKDENYGCEFIWANACVYTPDGVLSPEHGVFYDEDGYTPNKNGFKGILDQQPGTGVSDLTAVKIRNSSNLVTEEAPLGEESTVNYPYNGSDGDPIVIGEKETTFNTGVGMHAKDPATPVNGSVESWTIYDVKNVTGDGFHAAVGLTDEKGKQGSGDGVIFRLFGDYDGFGNYELLSESTPIHGKETGEFNVDISGTKYIKLVAVPVGKSPDNTACVWAEPCVYTRIPTVTKTEDAEAEEDGAGIDLTVGQIAIVAGIAVASAAVGALPVFFLKKKFRK